VGLARCQAHNPWVWNHSKLGVFGLEVWLAFLWDPHKKYVFFIFVRCGLYFKRVVPLKKATTPHENKKYMLFYVGPTKKALHLQAKHPSIYMKLIIFLGSMLGHVDLFVYSHVF
jgi:hypothetical protein